MHNPRVLMFGWEFPPFNSGGLGTACQGLTHALSDHNVDVTFVLPRKVAAHSQKVKLTFADQREVNMEYYKYLFNPYISTQLFKRLRKTLKAEDVVSSDLITEVYKYSVNARNVVKEHTADIIHAHDWLAFGAGLEAKHITKKPLVVHVHATEMDRTGFNAAHPHIYQIEKEGMKRADRVVAVSGYTREVIIKHYKIPRHKVEVVHNGIDLNEYKKDHSGYVQNLKKHFGKIVLFVGRLTLQKGPDYFLKAAKRVLEHDKNVTFIVAGAGDAEHAVIHEASHMGIANKIFFTGFLRGEELNKIFQAADLYVMPSVSEPFGIACLEALANGTPVLISKQSGVSEVLTHALKVDFWDTEEMANKILSLIHHRSLYNTLKHNSSHEIKKFSWHESAKKCANIYSNLLHH